MKNKKIIYYNLSGEIKREEYLTIENLHNIGGMMTKCYMINGKENIGYADPEGSYDDEKYDRKIHEYIYLWTWDNLDESTGKLIGNDDEKFNQTFKAVKIDDIEKIEAILYSNPRWGGKLTNKFEFYCKDKNIDVEIPKFLKNNENREIEIPKFLKNNERGK